MSDDDSFAEEGGFEDSDQSDDFDLSNFTQPGPNRSDYDDFIFSVLDAETIMDEMHGRIQEVIAVKNMPESSVRVLLSQNQWDKERLLEKLFSGEQEKLLSSVAPVFRTAEEEMAAFKAKNAPKDEKFDCPICSSQTVVNDTYCMCCWHRFCRACWQHYLTMEVIDTVGESIRCPQTNCNTVVDDKFVVRMLKNPDLQKRYWKRVSESFVQSNRLMNWCPSPDCTNVIKVNNKEPRPVTCKCGKVFCFGCLKDAHEPVPCEILKMWKKKCIDDSETSHWLIANTKECPKCHVSIEKNGGCNHMVCRNVNCKADFCWVCLNPWEPHGTTWFRCNLFNEGKSVEPVKQRKSRLSLERYMFYFDRYSNHQSSSKFENVLYTTIEERMELMQKQMSWIEVQFLRMAVDTLLTCRRTLMYSYAFAFYLEKNNQTIIFEDNQRDLEMATEQLSEYLERGMEVDNLAEVKQRCQDKTKYCDNRRRVLLDHVKEGLEGGFWKYLSSDHL